MILADVYLNLSILSKDLAIIYCLKQKKEKIGRVAKYLFISLPIPRILIGESIFFYTLTTSKLEIFKKLLISCKFKSCVLISGILNLRNVAKLKIGDHKGE